MHQDDRLADVVAREQPRLWNFIRRRVPDPRDAEDILQDVFYKLVEANRLLMPIDHVTGWLFRVARNRITDLFRRARAESLDDNEDLLPAVTSGPDGEFMRAVLVEELEGALAALPEDQRSVFVAHEIEGRSFKEISAESGVGINTLLSRKRYAVLRLREHLRAAHDELTNKRGRE